MPTILITGANRGLGLEFARQYKEDGWNVLACCRNPEEGKELSKITSNIYKLDVSNFEQIDKLASLLKGESIDVLINNAGISGNGSKNKFGSMNYDDWEKTMRINCMAPFKLSEALIENVEKSEEKTIVSITSKMGSIGDNELGRAYIYRSSKSALNMTMKSLSIDLKEKGIKIAVLHPGWVKTDMGGPNALIDVETSISGMKKVINNLTEDQSGKFFDYSGKEVDW